MFGGPPTPPRGERTEDREAVGSYPLVHNLAEIGERLFAEPGHIVNLGITCPACADAELQGRANKYTRSFAISCPNCTFTISR
ncbi:MAG: hypothetical protein M3Q29_24120 [Chloroflexota bacterium]|nr:hypothetical protein [Chloroflexota bacterium]